MVMIPPMDNTLDVVKWNLIGKLHCLLDFLSASSIVIETILISPPIGGDVIGRLLSSTLVLTLKPSLC
jgi:hypothetical protein